MYYGNTKLVPIPETSDKGKIIVASSGYVYIQTGYTWDPKKRQPHYERRTIGKRDNTQPKMMYYSKDYIDIFGEVDPEIVDSKNEHGKLEGKVAGKINYCVSFGPYIAIEAACEKAGCLSPLKHAFESQWKRILALCTHAIVEEGMTSQSFSGWCFLNYCGINRMVEDTEISELYKYISKNKENINVFFELFWKEYCDHFPETKKKAVGFDSTNQNYGGKGIPWAKLGDAKIDVGLPIIDTAMLVDEETGIPLWYEHFDGSVLDKTQTPFSLKKVVNLEFKKLFVIFDRGYYSEKDIKELQKFSEIEFGIMCPNDTNWVEDLIRKHGPEIKDIQKHYIPEENVYGEVYDVNPFKENDKLYYAYLFYDSERASAERDTIHEAVAYYWKQANSRKRYTDKMARDFGAQGIIVVKEEKNKETGKNFQLHEDTEMIQKLLDIKGFFVMISPTKMFPSEAIRIIRRRDMSEKGFARMMNHFNIGSTGRKKTETYEGMMFIAFIALICLSSFQYFEKSFLRSRTSYTIATIISELKKYQININYQTGKWEPGYAMNIDQKIIMENLNLTEAEVQKKIGDIEVQEGQSL